MGFPNGIPSGNIGGGTMMEKFESLKRDLSPDSQKQSQAKTVRQQALAWLADPANTVPREIKLSAGALAAAGFGNREKGAA